MDYEFSTDPRGRPQAWFSTGHEAIGHWFSHELGHDTRLMERLLEAIAQIRSHRRPLFEWQGREYALQLDADEARVSAHALFETDQALDDGDLDDALHYYDAESTAGCGLDDFEAVLHAWRLFIEPR